MATVASLHFMATTSPLALSSATVQGIRKCQNPSIFCFKRSQLNAKSSTSENQAMTTRRNVLIQTVFSAAPSLLFAPNSLAEIDVQENFRVYSDEENKFKISIPQDWQVGEGEPNGYKSITAFYPQEASNCNVSVVITGLGPDFTKLQSFGNVDAFAETLVSGLDKSWQRPPGVVAKLLNSKAANGLYYIEYSLQNPGESHRHIFSAIGVASNGWYNRLYTVTGQFMDEESEKYGSKIEKSVSSFRLI